MKNRAGLIFTGIVVFSTGLFSSVSAQNVPYVLAPLPYGYTVLEPVIDAHTMENHYSGQHASYVNNLNVALRDPKYAEYSPEELLLYASEVGDDIRNSAGGHNNHTMFWNILAVNNPFDGQSEIGKAVIASFGSPDNLNTLLIEAGAARFGSGWVWLYITPDMKLAVCSTPNEDNPVMDISTERGVPILGIDVWEHAYQLKYPNRRMDYLKSVVKIINWKVVNKNYTETMHSELLRTVEKETWTELNSFHVVMGQTFHPSEDGNLKPIRTRSGEMAEKAKILQGGRIPPSFNTPQIKTSIDNLVSGSNTLHQMVLSNSDDKMVTDKLGELHDTFHTIVGLCRH